MKKILLVGAGGFIGSKVLYRLASMNFKTIAVFRSMQEKELINNYNDLKIDYYIGDISDRKFCNKITENIDYVINQAGLIQGDEDQLFDSNILGFYNLISAARNNNVQKFIFASSASVYGNTSSKIQSENFSMNPISFYGISKEIEEIISGYYSDKMEIHILRYFNVYGSANIHSRDVVSMFFLKSLKNEKIIVDHPNVKRDFIHINDIVEINIIASTTDVFKNELIINVGTGISTSILDVAKKIKILTGSSSEIEIGTSKASNLIMNSCADSNKLLNIFNYKFKTTFDEYLKDIYEKNKEVWEKTC